MIVQIYTLFCYKVNYFTIFVINNFYDEKQEHKQRKTIITLL